MRAQLETLVAVAEGRPRAARWRALPQSERFHWITAPSSTIVQPSPVHTGLTDDPAGELERLFARAGQPARAARLTGKSKNAPGTARCAA